MSGLLGGVLPAIFSQADRAKRYIGGLLADPVGRMQQAGGQAVDDLSKLGLLSEQAFNDPRNPMKLQDNAAARQLTDTYLNSVLNFAPVGMNVWHGSPHKFDRFDSSKIGTGAGAQAYGHGLYLAESPAVAKQYQEGLSDFDMFVKGSPYNNADPAHRAAEAMKTARDGGQSLGDVMARLQRSIKDLKSRKQPWADELAAEQAGTLQVLSSGKVPELDIKSKGSLYKVDLPDDAIAKMLDWDKPLSQQAPEAQRFFSDVSRPPGADMPVGEWLKPRFAEGAAPYWSDDMLKAGIPGIRYLDGGSRGVGAGSSNFVVFPGNESLLTILERNGQPLR